jgi:hypothetical protein
MRCENCIQLEARVRELLQRILHLEAALRESSESHQEAEDRMTRTIANQEGKLREADRRERERQDESYWREDRLKELDRARERGDKVDQDRIVAKLKRGW